MFNLYHATTSKFKELRKGSYVFAGMPNIWYAADLCGSKFEFVKALGKMDADFEMASTLYGEIWDDKTEFRTLKPLPVKVAIEVEMPKIEWDYDDEIIVEKGKIIVHDQESYDDLMFFFENGQMKIEEEDVEDWFDIIRAF